MQIKQTAGFIVGLAFCNESTDVSVRTQVQFLFKQNMNKYKINKDLTWLDFKN